MLDALGGPLKAPTTAAVTAERAAEQKVHGHTGIASAARSDHKLSPTNVGNYHDFFHTEHTNERRTVAPKLH